MVEQPSWAPIASVEALRARATLYAAIRSFFLDRNVLEVETPLLCHRTVTDPLLAAFKTSYQPDPNSLPIPLYLQTSPEFAMKRLLSSGVGSIFQITKAFRDGEYGRHHNPEFTLLEWYRVGFDLSALMTEVEMLIGDLANQFGRKITGHRTTYLEAFQQYLGIHPLEASLDEMAAIAREAGLVDALDLCRDDRSAWLDFLFSCLIQPRLPRDTLTMVTRYPGILPSLARRSKDDAQWVERVEIFLGGLELGNGFDELTDAREQEARFLADLNFRKKLGLALPLVDDRLLGALDYGMPDAAGIAIGLDRLLMVLMGLESIDKTLAFAYPQA